MPYKKLITLNVFLFLSLIVYCQENIQLNQLGFYVNAPKMAVITATAAGDDFYILSANKDTVFKGLLSNQQQSLYSSTVTRLADFSGVHTTGKFVMYVPGAGVSWQFIISSHALGEAAVKSLKGFYYQRVSMPLEEAYAGKWHRAAGHPDTAVLVHPSAATSQRPAGKIISSTGGWYDAGDYNKYIVNSGISTGTLLSAYEDYSSYFDTLKTNIPESNDGVPDILNEVLYNVRWMLTMQDADDGGVYNKCTNAAFDGMVMPGVTKLPRYVVKKGTAATLDFAAVMAQCARICKAFHKQLPGLSDSCLHAAELAWQWALKNPALQYNQDSMNKLYEPKITTGGYGDAHFEDEWFWAACELYVTTKKKDYITEVERGISKQFTLPSWANVDALGFYTLLRKQNEISINVTDVKKKVLPFADTLLAGGNKAFATVMGQSKRDFIWGSNAVAANESIVLLNAYIITKNKKYIDAALTNLDYILGRNATHYCFITGMGSKSTMHPHHRPSVADGIEEPVPGLMAGGPNPRMQDHCAYMFKEPETAYADSDCAYASNEIAINWNAPLVYVANAIEALQYVVGYSGK